MKKQMMCTAALLLLAACGTKEQTKGEDMSAEQVAGELSTMRIEPGQWEATNEIISASAPGMPADALKAMVGQRTTVRNCITPEQAARPNANFLAAQEDSNCTYQDWSMEGGRMTGTMTCKGDAEMGGTIVMKMDGTYGEESYDMVMDMETKMSEDMSMTIKARTTGKRIGECPDA